MNLLRLQQLLVKFFVILFSIAIGYEKIISIKKYWKLNILFKQFNLGNKWNEFIWVWK